MADARDEQDARSRWQRVCAVLDEVLDAPVQERERILREHCGEDAALRAEVEALLQGEDDADTRVDSPVSDWAANLIDQEDESVSAYTEGDVVGPYRLIRELGRGGMGTVWLAERTDTEFEQKVALKLLKRGVDTDAVLSRFREERRILARLKHPHIALFLDGGVTDQGQPWFSMEWVDGDAITKWCDSRKLEIRERVKLFLDVIAAVQYAHQQLIVHRDLKPGNVLVDQDGGVKLLDFGIAKMLDVTQGSAAPATMTRLGWRMLTPEYAAPEQLHGQPITTATDVYALGVLLCELLSGRRPPQRSANAGDDAPAPRPSSLVDDSTAALRDTSGERLRRQLRGDLDTITLKALSSEPGRRYGSAQALGEDLQRWLDGEPVQARPDSSWYRMRRFVGRHRLGVAASVLVVVSLVSGALVAAWQAREASRQALEAQRQTQVAQAQTLEAQRQTKRAEQVKDFLVRIFQASNPSEWKGKEPSARDLLEIGARRVDEELGQDPLLHAQMQRVIGVIFFSRGDFQRADSLLRTSMAQTLKHAGKDSKDYADALHAWADFLYVKGDYAGATEAVENEIQILRSKFAQHSDLAPALGMLANLRDMSGRLQEAISLRKEALEITRRAYGTMQRGYADGLLELGQLYLKANRPGDAKPLLDESLRVAEVTYGPDSTLFANALNGQARLMNEAGDLVAAADGFRRAAEIYRNAEFDQEFVRAMTNRGLALCRMGKFEEGARSYDEALQAQQRYPSPFLIDTLKRSYGRCLSDGGRYAQAEAMLRDSVGLNRAGESQDRDFVLAGASIVLRLMVRQGRIPEARALVGRVEKALGPIKASDSWHAAIFLVAAAQVSFDAGDRKAGISILKQATQSLRETNAPERTITSAELDLASMELQNGQAQSAEARLLALGNVLDGGPQGPLGLHAQMLRGVALMELGQLPASEQLLRTALQARTAMYGDGNFLVEEARLYLGICLYRRGQVAQGRTLIDAAKRQLSRESGRSQPFAARLADSTLQGRPSH